MWARYREDAVLACKPVGERWRARAPPHELRPAGIANTLAAFYNYAI